jgi:hypothetical protein
MANFPGGDGAIPGVYDIAETVSSGTSVPGGQRLAVLVGEGSRIETLVSNANGSGRDGLNSTYSSTAGADGRHFKLSNFPIQSNRTTVYKNGIPLAGLQEVPNGNSFSSLYDYRIDIATGKIELQGASLVDQGGQNYLGSLLNVGDGTISSLTLVDTNAPSETWTVRCVSVRRDGYGDPIDGYAKFIGQGSVSGIPLDGYGSQITWQSNGVVISNGILSFAINEGLGDSFREGDRFTIKVKGGALTRGETLAVTYIAVNDINTPELFTDIEALVRKHGMPSTSNRLSLAAQLAFASSPPGVYACQAAPSVPRRLSYILEESASGDSVADDLNFALPLGVVPSPDANINFFVTDPVTETESQILPNKVTFYDSTITASPNTFHFGAGYTYSYTVILDPNYKIMRQADDGVLTNLTGTTARLSSTTLGFTAADAVATRRIRILNPGDNPGIFAVVSVSNGEVVIQRSSGSFVDETTVEFEVLDQDGSGARVLFTDDLAPSAGQVLRATVVDVKDASFFDVGWQQAYQALETIEVDIVVPVPSQTISSCFALGRAHCETMSNVKNRKERVLFIGAIRGLEPANVTGEQAAAVEDIGVLEGIQGDEVTEILAGDTEDLTNYGIQNSYGGTFRVVYFYPDEIVVQIGADRTFVDGFFMAAAAAGYLSAVPNIAIPLTNKVLPGFSILNDKLFRPLVLEQLTAAGACLLQPALGGGTVIWGRTTTGSGFPEEEEISIVFIRDRILKDLRIAMRGFIGQAESSTTQGSIMARANSMMISFIARGLITAWKDLAVARDKVDPRQWNVTVRVQPVYSINFVYIKVGVGVL